MMRYTPHMWSVTRNEEEEFIRKVQTTELKVNHTACQCVAAALGAVPRPWGRF